MSVDTDREKKELTKGGEGKQEGINDRGAREDLQKKKDACQSSPM